MDINQTLESVYRNLPGISRVLENSRHKIIFFHWDALMLFYSGGKIKKRIRKQLIKLIHRLNQPPAINCVLISVLPLEEIEREFSLGELTYAGNFGLEIESRSSGWSIPGHKMIKNELKRLDELLHQENPFGIEIITNNLGMIYQIRWNNSGVSVKDLRKKLLPLFSNPSRFKIVSRYQQFDIFPNVEWNLMNCVEKVTDLLNFERGETARFYFGCVQNDEPVFKGMTGSRDFAIWVGEKPIYRTVARYYLSNLKEMIQFLQWIYSKTG